MAQQDLGSVAAMTKSERLTLLDLVAAVQSCADTDAEVVATLRYMLESGHVHFEEVTIGTARWAA